jgi:hypothetical protein
MQNWKKVWRDGLVPLLSTRELEALRQGLAGDDMRLIQHATCTPPPSEIFHEEAVEGACALGFCAWQGDRLETVGEVEGFFIRTCLVADEALGEPGACRHFLNWFDETPRAQMRWELLQEVTRAINQRHTAAA